MVASRSLEIALPPLHPLQQEIAEDGHRFKVAACGRRFGKTRLGVVLCVRAGLEGRRAWWVAPSFPLASVAWREARALARQVPGCLIRESERELLFPGPLGGSVRVKSADSPDSLRGEGLDLVVVDEAAFVADAIWYECLRPALADRQGKAVFLSTPRGRNLFWRLFGLGQDPAELEWKSWQAPTASNPFIEAAEIEAARAGMPERAFRQEFLADFVDDAGAVFRLIREAATAQRLERAVPGRSYVVGGDWGKSNDFTVFSVFDRDSGEMVALDRFNQIDYALQRRRLMALCQRFHPDVVVAEANSIGVPIIEQLQRDGLPVEPFTTSNASKALIIDALALAFEQRTIRILPEPALLAELEAFGMAPLAGGLTRYSAPEGMHDDCVISLALAWSACAVGGGSGDGLAIPGTPAVFAAGLQHDPFGPSARSGWDE